MLDFITDCGVYVRILNVTKNEIIDFIDTTGGYIDIVPTDDRRYKEELDSEKEYQLISNTIEEFVNTEKGKMIFGSFPMHKIWWGDKMARLRIEHRNKQKALVD